MVRPSLRHPPGGACSNLARTGLQQIHRTQLVSSRIRRKPVAQITSRPLTPRSYAAKAALHPGSDKLKHNNARYSLPTSQRNGLREVVPIGTRTSASRNDECPKKKSALGSAAACGKRLGQLRVVPRTQGSFCVPWPNAINASSHHQLTRTPWHISVMAHSFPRVAFMNQRHVLNSRTSGAQDIR